MTLFKNYLDNEIASLEDTPVSFVDIPFATLRVIVNGNPPYSPASTAVLVTKTVGSIDLIIAGGPFTVPAGGVIYPQFVLCQYPEGGHLSMGAGESELLVSNAAGTQKIAVENFAIANVPSFVTDPVDVLLDGGNIDQHIGVDLSVNGSNQIASAAGGEYFVTFFCEIIYSPPA